MVGGQFDFVVGREHAGPFLLGLVKEALNGDLELRGGVLVAETQELLAFPFPWYSGEFVVEVGEDKLKHFLKHIHAGIGEHFVFEVFNQLA